VQVYKQQMTIPEDHQLEIRLPQDFPAGPAEVIVLATLPPVDGNRALLAALEDLRTMERTEEEERVLEDFERFQLWCREI
jgi:hypothetical protein